MVPDYAALVLADATVYNGKLLLLTSWTSHYNLYDIGRRMQDVGAIGAQIYACVLCTFKGLSALTSLEL